MALTGSQKQKELNQMSVDTKARHYYGPVKTYFSTIYVQNRLLTYSYSTILLEMNLLSLFRSLN